MKEYRVNLIDGIRPVESKKIVVPTTAEYLPAATKVGRFFFRCSVILLVIIIFFSFNTIFPSQGLVGNLGHLSFWEGVARLALSRDKILKGELSDRINILILGISGPGYDGPYLSDSTILVSLKPSTKEAVIFSIPRDLYVPSKEFGWQKINALNSLGMVRSDDGAALTASVINDIFEIPVQYWITFDFAAFKNLIDWMGGIEINVDRSFVDTQYPGPQFSFRTVNFKAGPQTMNGDQSLILARSRHGNNGEATDFARMKRQQKIILAVKEKITKENMLSSPTKLWEIYNIFRQKIATNLDFAEMARLAKIATQINQDKIKTYTFEAGPNGLVYPETAIDGAYILKPTGGNFQQMAAVFKNAFANETGLTNPAPNFLPASPSSGPPSAPAASSAAAPSSVGGSPAAKLIILNGTYLTGLAQKAKTKLEGLGYEVDKIGNSPSRDYQQTVIYLVAEKDQPTTERIKTDLGAETALLPKQFKYLTMPGVNYLIVLGVK